MQKRKKSFILENEHRLLRKRQKVLNGFACFARLPQVAESINP